MLVNQNILEQLISYDPDTGVVVRIGRVVTGGKIKPYHNVPTTKSASGYLQIGILSKIYYTHRLIFLLINGEFPQYEVDHINGDRIDNRWVNLRLVTRGVNVRNSGKNSKNTSGFNGVYFDKAGKKWLACIWREGAQRHLGYFDNIEDAVEARRIAEIGLGYTDDHGVRESWQS